MPFPERFVELVEEERSALEARLVLGVCENQASDQLLDPGRLGAHELAVLEIDVVDDLPDLRQRPLREPHPRQERLERAAIPLVAEIPAHNVKADLASARRLFRIDEPEPRLRIDEAADGPGGGDAVDVNAAACPPRRAAELLAALRARRATSSLRFESPQELLHGRLSASLEEVDPRDLLETLPRPGDGRGEILDRARAAALANRIRQRVVVRFPLATKLLDERGVRSGFQEVRVADVRLAASGDGFFGDPLKILETLLAARQHIDGVFQGHGAHAGEALANLGAQIERLGRELVHEDVPPQRRLALLLPCHRAASAGAGRDGSITAAQRVPATPSRAATEKVRLGRIVHSAPPTAAAPATTKPRIV